MVKKNLDKTRHDPKPATELKSRSRNCERMASYFLMFVAGTVLSIIALEFIRADDGPVVQTKYGPVRGRLVDVPNGQCSVFLGVPFAEPPVGELRFAKPVPPKPWTETKATTDFGPVCVQEDPPNFANYSGHGEESEDCLYLNIFVPNQDTSEKLPVMFFIHGGGFIFGSAKEYGNEGICENLSLRGVITVTVQYRLSFWGFLSTGDEAALGNFAIWDQLASLKWVNENIAAFGGDPDRITIFGESAGGASVSYLTYTELAKDLFHQSIGESGSALSFWAALSDDVINSTQLIIDASNCSNSDSTLEIECLRQIPTWDLKKIYEDTKPPHGGLGIRWTARVDGEIFTQQKFRELNTKRAAIIGTNSQEFPADPQTEPVAGFLFNDALKNVFIGMDTESEVLQSAAWYAYIDSKGDRTNHSILCQQLSALQTDLMFKIAADQEALSKTKSGSPVWMYNFDHYSENLFPPDYKYEKGATHAHELCYLFLKALPPNETAGPNTCPATYEGADRTVANNMGEMWTNFAIKGDPSPSDLTWNKFQDILRPNTMTIREYSDNSSALKYNRINFWNVLVGTIEKIFE